ncbi:hypothetical protein [Kitasatospora albolonga]|uniref:hypothetical protein n=1 Tax=Kitasatospora albolonga TaxID=68173 RepID=UPI0031ECA601
MTADPWLLTEIRRLFPDTAPLSLDGWEESPGGRSRCPRAVVDRSGAVPPADSGALPPRLPPQSA